MICVIEGCEAKCRFLFGSGNYFVDGGHKCGQTDVSDFLNIQKIRKSIKEMATEHRDLPVRITFSLC